MSKLKLVWLALPLFLMYQSSIPSRIDPSIVHEIIVPAAPEQLDPIEIEVISRGTVDRIPSYDIPLSRYLQEYTYDLCNQYGIVEHYSLVIAVMAHESRFDAAAISASNDYGLMQINKGNHAWLSEELNIVDFLDAEQNIHAGIYMLSDYLLKYDTIEKALMAYNMGERNARKCWDAGIYKTSYTEAVLDQLKKIKKGEYI